MTLNFFFFLFKAIWEISTIQIQTSVSHCGFSGCCPREKDALVLTWLSFTTPFPFRNRKEFSILEKIRSGHCACRNISVILATTESCLINVNKMLSLNLDEADIKIQISYN